MRENDKTKALKAERAYYAAISRVELREELGAVIRNVDIRTMKSQAVLTHTSIMIAVLGAFIAFTDRSSTPQWVTLALLLELLGYIFLTAYLMLTMAVSSPGLITGDGALDKFILLTRKRRRMHNFVVKAVAVLTVVLALTLIAEFLVYLTRS